MSFEQFLTTLQKQNISEIVCLVSQLLLTLHTTWNLNKNKQQFPVKQLSPLLSLVALYSFFILNIISFTGKIIEDKNGYYNPTYQGNTCGQCRIFHHPQMIVLAFLYNGLRQLPLILFIIKTYRVCLCYDKEYNQNLSQTTIKLFSKQRNLLILSIVITLILSICGYFIFGDGNQSNGNLVFQFFCPKQSGIYDWIINGLRFVAMAYVYSISLYTYNQLDFKKFLILIFIFTNTEVILRLCLALGGITKTTYHQFYYHSFLMNLFGTLIMMYYSSFKQRRSMPLGPSILQSFRGFVQNSLGLSVLLLFAQHLDKQNMTKKYQYTYLAYIELDQIFMQSSYEDDFKIQNYTQSIKNILTKIQFLQDIPQRKKLLQKCEKNTLILNDLKNVQTRLKQFCQRQIFREWKMTQSAKYLEIQFRNNRTINSRMHKLGIQL